MIRLVRPLAVVQLLYLVVALHSTNDTRRWNENCRVLVTKEVHLGIENNQYMYWFAHSDNATTFAQESCLAIYGPTAEEELSICIPHLVNRMEADDVSKCTPEHTNILQRASASGGVLDTANTDKESLQHLDVLWKSVCGDASSTSIACPSLFGLRRMWLSMVFYLQEVSVAALPVAFVSVNDDDAGDAPVWLRRLFDLLGVQQMSTGQWDRKVGAAGDFTTATASTAIRLPTCQ